MDHILSAAAAYAQAKIEEAFALKSGTSEQYDATVKRSDDLYDRLRETISMTLHQSAE